MDTTWSKVREWLDLTILCPSIFKLSSSNAVSELIKVSDMQITLNL